jgi:hypothetical protein
MAFKTLEDGMPITPDLMNNYVTNSGWIWKSSTAFSGGTSYIFDGSLDGSSNGMNRIVLSGLTSGTALNLFLQMRTTAGATITSANYYTGMYQINSGAAVTQSLGPATTVFYIGLVSSGTSSYTLDISMANGGYVNMVGKGNHQDTNFIMGGNLRLTGNNYGGFSITLFGGATVFSGKVNTYYMRSA